MHLAFNAGAKVAGLRVGYFPAWMKEDPATDVDRAALETVKKLGMTPVAVSIPDWPYDSLNLICSLKPQPHLKSSPSATRWMN
jgi:hypothetical protein